MTQHLDALWSRRLFYAGEHVRSQFHGSGVVTTSGNDPTVRYVTGAELPTAGKELQFISANLYHADQQNRCAIEEWLRWRVYGVIPSSRTTLPEPELDLATAMEQHAEYPPLPSAEARPSGGVAF